MASTQQRCSNRCPQWNRATLWRHVIGAAVVMCATLAQPTYGTESEAAVFTKTWGVEISGGDDDADAIAAEQGFLNGGQIGSLKHHYYFRIDCDTIDCSSTSSTSTSTTTSSTLPSGRGESGAMHAHTELLRQHPKVIWTEQQVKLQRRRRSTLRSIDGATILSRDNNSTTVRALRSRRMAISDPSFPNQWHLKNIKNANDINVMPVWDMDPPITGKGVVVTIVDDGMEHDHPDLIDNYDPIASDDLNSNIPSDHDPYPNERDPINKHGTRCSGEIGAAKNNNCGIGIAYNSKIGAVRMLDGDVTDAVEAGSLSLAPNHIDIYTNSWGPNDDGRTIEGPARLAWKAFQDGINEGRNGKGSIYLFASGNGGSRDDCNCDGYANGIFTLAIGAIDEYNKKPYYSENCASMQAVTYSSGGGRSITTTDLHQGCTSSHSGTSAAAPIAAGILALMLEANPDLTWRDVQHCVIESAVPISTNDASWSTNSAGLMHSHQFGFGKMDAKKLVDLALDWKKRKHSSGKQIIYGTETASPEAVFGSYSDAVSVIEVKEGDTTIKKMEHILIEVNIGTGRRGYTLVDFECPSGMKSSLMSSRSETSSSTIRWNYSTVRCWNEGPVGKYKLTVGYTSGSSASNKLHSWRVYLHGNAGSDASSSAGASETPSGEPDEPEASPTPLPTIESAPVWDTTAPSQSPTPHESESENTENTENAENGSEGGGSDAATACSPCPRGTSVDMPSGVPTCPRSCTPCAPGTYNDVKDGNCRTIQPGFMAKNAQVEGYTEMLPVDQDPCGKGYACPGGASFPVACERGTYQPTEGGNSCWNCPEGETSLFTAQKACVKKPTPLTLPRTSTTADPDTLRISSKKDAVAGLIGGLVGALALIFVAMLVACTYKKVCNREPTYAAMISPAEFLDDFDDTFDIDEASLSQINYQDDSGDEEEVYDKEQLGRMKLAVMSSKFGVEGTAEIQPAFANVQENDLLL